MEINVSFVQNNIALIVAAAASGILLLWQIFRKSRHEIGTMVAVQLINYKEALVLDVRERSEFESGHIPNAKHIPADKLEERLHEIEKFKNKPIVIIHRTGASTTGKAGSILRNNGFAHVHDLGGGIDAWKQANLPIVKK